MTPAQRARAPGGPRRGAERARTPPRSRDHRARADPRRDRATAARRLDAARPGAVLVRGLRRPGGAAPWAWRVGGHHVAIQRPSLDGAVVGAAPSFLGANPATSRAGRRPASGRSRARRRSRGRCSPALSPAERRVAVVDPVAPPDILSGNGRRADVRDSRSGIRHDGAGAGQRAGLEALIRHYLGRVARRRSPTPRGSGSSRTAWRRHVRVGRPGRAGPGPLLRDPRAAASSSSTTTPRTARTTSTRSGATWPTTGARTPSPRTTAPVIARRDRPSGAGQPAYAAGATPIANRTRST